MGISLHPFIDQTDRQASAEYQRPEQVGFDDGTSLARYMPSSVGGKQLRGVVVPHAKPLGGSRAYDPHKPPHRRIHIDPHIEGQSVVVDLDRVTQDIAEEAATLGREYAEKHGSQLPAIEQVRLQGAAAFHLIGASQRSQDAPAPPQSPEPKQVITVPQNDVQGSIPSAPPETGPRTIKAASFNNTVVQTQPQTKSGEPQGGLLGAFQKSRAQPVEVAAASMPVSPPTKKVTFGVPGFGLHEAYYHRVIISNQQFVLVYDERYQGGNKYLPQIDGPFAARVEGDPMDYKLVWPDQSFTDPDTGRTYVSLLIEERVSQGGES
jgi:hypothetical protein